MINFPFEIIIIYYIYIYFVDVYDIYMTQNQGLAHDPLGLSHPNFK